MAKQTYDIEEIKTAALSVLHGNDMAALSEEITPEARSGARAGIFALLLTLGLSIKFADGVVWHAEPTVVPDGEVGDDEIMKAINEGRKDLN